MEEKTRASTIGGIAAGAVFLGLLRAATHCGDDAIRGGSKILFSSGLADDAAKGAASASHVADDAARAAHSVQFADDGAKQAEVLAHGAGSSEKGIEQGGRRLAPSRSATSRAEEPSTAERIAQDVEDIARSELRRRRNSSDDDDEDPKSQRVSLPMAKR